MYAVEVCAYMRIYAFGNPLVKKDSMPLLYIKKLRSDFPDIEFIEIDPAEEIPKEKNLFILDTAVNAQKVRIITDIGKLESGRACSLHDFDLAFSLKLMRKMGFLENAAIIAIPPRECYDALKASISSLLSGNA